MSDDKCDFDDCKVKLYQYTLVSLKRGRERILEKDQRLVMDRMDDCEFQNLIIADYVREHPETPVRWLRVFADVLHTWDKQPLHYQQKQLDYLEDIAHSQKKLARSLPELLGGQAVEERRRRREAAGDAAGGPL